MTDVSLPSSRSGMFSSNRSAAVLTAFFFLALYWINGDVQRTADVEGTIHTAVNLVERGTLAVKPSTNPFLFIWEMDTPAGKVRGHFLKWESIFEGQTMRSYEQAGRLKVVAGSYYITPSTRRDPVSGERLYVNSYGPGPALCAAPLFYLLSLFFHPLADFPGLLWYGSKFIASALVAASVALLFGALQPYMERRHALFLAFCYGAGTCVWTASSQALLQHAPCEFFITLGIYFLATHPEPRTYGFWSGIAFAAAAACRPTALVLPLFFGIYLLIQDRKAVGWFLLGSLPILLPDLYYNWYYLGSPLNFGQTEVAKHVAFSTTGKTDLWQTPLWLGLAGILFSPARGLFMFSPFAIFSFAGILPSWNDPRLKFVRPLIVTFFAWLITSAKWFDWWGGFSYGYRLIVDVSPLLILFLIPIFGRIWKNRLAKTLFLMCVVWSVFVQLLGALAFDGLWSARTSYRVQVTVNSTPVLMSETEAEDAVRKGASNLGPVQLNIDKPEYRYRLWSFEDQPILYYVTHFHEARLNRQKLEKEIGEGR